MPKAIYGVASLTAPGGTDRLQSLPPGVSHRRTTLGGAARHEVTGEGGLPKGKQKDRPAERPDRIDLIHGVASLTAPLARLRRAVPLASLRSGGTNPAELGSL